MISKGGWLYSLSLWLSLSSGRIPVQEGSGYSPYREEGILSVSPSLIFLLSIDFDLSGNLKLSLGYFTVGWKLQYKVVVGHSLPLTFSRQGNPLHWCDSFMCLQDQQALPPPLALLPHPNPQFDHQNKQTKKRKQPKTSTSNCFDLTFGEEELDTSWC